MANRQHIIIKNKKRENMHTDRCGNTSGQKCHMKGIRKEITIQEFLYRAITNVEYKMYDYTSNKWSQQNSNKRFKEKFGSHTRKTFNRFTTKDNCTWNITHDIESTAIWNWSLCTGDHQWFKKSTREKRPVTRDDDNDDDDDNNNNNNKNTIIIIIIIIIYL